MDFLNFFGNTVSIIFWFIVVLIPLVIIHELGHLLAAKLFGVKIPEFGIGMPLTRHRYSKVWKGIRWSVYPWMLGGFVRIYGDQDAIDNANDEYLKSPKDSKEAKNNYINSRLSELTQTQDLQTFLKDNDLEFNSLWQWVDNLCLIEDNNKELTLKYYLDSFKFNKEIPNFLSQSPFNSTLGDISKNLYKNSLELNKEDQEGLLKLLSDKYQSQKNTIQTLIDWEFDAKISSKHKPKKSNLFLSKNWIQKSVIIFGGITFNFIAAIILLSVLFGFFGSIPATRSLEGKQLFRDEIAAIEKQGQSVKTSKGLIVDGANKEFPAFQAGIKRKDELLSLNDVDLTNILNYEQFKEILKNTPDNSVLVYRDSSNQEIKNVIISPKVDTADKNQKKLGLSLGYETVRYASNPIQAVAMGWNETITLSKLTFNAILDIFKALSPTEPNKAALNNAGGPILTGYLSGSIFAREGARGIVYIMAAISIGLAIFNLLPIPALDGGRFLIILISKITGKRNRKFENIAISITFIALLVLAVIIAGNDIRQIISFQKQ